MIGIAIVAMVVSFVKEDVPVYIPMYPATGGVVDIRTDVGTQNKSRVVGTYLLLNKMQPAEATRTPESR